MVGVPAVPHCSLPTLKYMVVASGTASSEPAAEGLDPAVAPKFPDVAYLALLDKYTESFFRLDYLDDSPDLRRQRLYASKVTVRRAYYAQKEHEETISTNAALASVELSEPIHEDEQSQNEYTDTSILPLDSFPGTLWSVREKDAFFRCLARYSIHRIEAFRDHLPHKSDAEISLYYTLLKQELALLKTEKEHIVQFRDKTSPDLVSHWYTSQAFEDGATYSELPIACELSGKWVEYEENQSSLIAQREQKLAQNSEKLLRKSMLQKYGFTTGGVKDTHEYGVVDTRNLLRIQKMYRASEFARRCDNPEPRMFRFDSTVLLNELVRQRTKDILAALIVCKGLEGSAQGVPEFDFSENADLYDQFRLTPSNCIARLDVYRACDVLGLFEAPVSGWKSKNRDGKCPVLDNYWQGVVRSMRLNTDRNGALYAETPQAKYYQKNALGYVEKDAFVFPVEPQHDAWDYTDDVVDFSARGDILVGDQNGWTEKSASGVENPEQPTHTKGLEDALVEELLFIQETAALEKSDFKRDLQLHRQDTRRQEIKRRRIDLPVYTETERDRYFGDMWGETDMDTFCDSRLQHSWGHTFAEY